MELLRNCSSSSPPPTGKDARIQVVTHQHHLVRLSKMHLNDIFETGCKVHTRTSIGHVHVSPPFQRSKNHQQITYTIAIIFIIITLGFAYLSRQRLSSFLNLLLARFIDADQGPLRLRRPNRPLSADRFLDSRWDCRIDSRWFSPPREPAKKGPHGGND